MFILFFFFAFLLYFAHIVLKWSKIRFVFFFLKRKKEKKTQQLNCHNKQKIKKEWYIRTISHSCKIYKVYIAWANIILLYRHYLPICGNKTNVVVFFTPHRLTSIVGWPFCIQTTAYIYTLLLFLLSLLLFNMKSLIKASKIDFHERPRSSYSIRRSKGILFGTIWFAGGSKYDAPDFLAGNLFSHRGIKSLIFAFLAFQSAMNIWTVLTLRGNFGWSISTSGPNGAKFYFVAKMLPAREGSLIIIIKKWK